MCNVTLVGAYWLVIGLSHSPTISIEVKESVELNFLSPSGTSWPVLVWNLYFSS
jgi:hypothetical protein